MLEIETQVGDISQDDCDILVNLVNNHFWIGVLSK
jgi:hypothetical protein